MHAEGLLSYCLAEMTNGRMDGINRKIGAVLRQVYGFRDGHCSRSWNERMAKEPPAGNHPLLPAIEVECDCTHFLNFQPESRVPAAAAGMILVPAKL